MVSLGAHIAEKGHLDVLEAVRSLSPEVQEQIFLLIGGPPLAGDYHDELERQAAKAPHLVSVHGWVDKVDEWLRSADIYALASRREGMPLTLVEAMQRRATAVGYPVGGVPELIHDGQTGLIARLGDTDDLAAKIATLVSDRALADQLAARAEQFVLENNSDASMREKFERVAAECLGTPVLGSGRR